MARGLTVRDLLASPALGLSLHAGEQGLDQQIIWTHASELEDPSVWLEGGELLIALGLGLDDAPEAHTRYVERLVQRRVAGLLLGSQRTLHPDALRVADANGFPVLSAPYELPFTTVTRMVADAQGDKAQRRLLTHVRIFDTLRIRTEGTESVAELFRRLEELSGYSLHVLTASGGSPLPGLPPPPNDLMTDWDMDRQFTEFAGGYAVPIWLAGEAVATLVAREIPGRDPAGLSAIRHIATVAALELSAVYRERETARREGAELLLELFSGTVTPVKAAERLTAQDLPPGEGLVLGACTSPAPQKRFATTVHHRLTDAGVPHLMLERGVLYVVVRSDSIEDFGRVMAGEDLLVGISDSWTDVTALSLARQQARWALERAHAAGRTVHYDGGDDAFWLPADIESLRQLASEILGDVIAYDREHNSELLKSLVVYFEHDRRLSAAADVLFVHKHTLAYRLKRIEAITDRKLTRVSDAAQLWLALRALQITDELPG